MHTPPDSNDALVPVPSGAANLTFPAPFLPRRSGPRPGQVWNRVRDGVVIDLILVLSAGPSGITGWPCSVRPSDVSSAQWLIPVREGFDAPAPLAVSVESEVILPRSELRTCLGSALQEHETGRDFFRTRFLASAHASPVPGCAPHRIAV